jgi:hypothetical protein
LISRILLLLFGPQPAAISRATILPCAARITAAAGIAGRVFGHGRALNAHCGLFDALPMVYDRRRGEYWADHVVRPLIVPMRNASPLLGQSAARPTAPWGWGKGAAPWEALFHHHRFPLYESDFHDIQAV